MARYKTFCEFAKSFETKKTSRVFVIMFQNNSGKWWMEAQHHTRLTKDGIFRIANKSWQATQGYKMKIIEFDIDKGTILFEGRKEALNANRK